MATKCVALARFVAYIRAVLQVAGGRLPLAVLHVAVAVAGVQWQWQLLPTLRRNLKLNNGGSSTSASPAPWPFRVVWTTNIIGLEIRRPFAFLD